MIYFNMENINKGIKGGKFRFRKNIYLKKRKVNIMLANKLNYGDTIGVVGVSNSIDLDEKLVNYIKEKCNRDITSDIEIIIQTALCEKKIENQNVQNYQKMAHCGFEYYRENPSLSIHKYIKDILMTVKLL